MKKIAYHQLIIQEEDSLHQQFLQEEDSLSPADYTRRR
jgi:hypothetical protein